jgi:hypothetical protein
LLGSLGLAETVPGHVTVDPPAAQRAASYTFDLQLDKQSDVVQWLEVDGYALGDAPSNELARDWAAFSLDRVLSQYGPPSDVLVAWNPPTEKGSPVVYGLTVGYKDREFAVTYLGRGSLGGPGVLVRACPDLAQVSAVSLQVRTRNAREMKPDPSVYVYELEPATGMTVQAFYETYKEPGAHACFDVRSP